MDLKTSLASIKGVGLKTAEQFNMAGLKTIGDLIHFYPYRYDDFSEIIQIKDIQPGKVTLKVQAEDLQTKRVRRGLHITQATLVDTSGKVAAVWFNQPYRADQLRKAKGMLFVSGEFGLQGQKYQLINPSVEQAQGAHVNAARIVPIYRKVAGLKPHIVRKVLTELKPFIIMLPETLPLSIIKKEQLISYADAIKFLHFPETQLQLNQARERLGFEEMFSLVLASSLNKQSNSKLKGWKIPFSEETAKKFVNTLPFKLTNAQRIAMWQIAQDFEKDHPMNRLLQGDVGSGKTVVAGMAASLAAKQGFQSALMAPTEILAAQHAETLDKLLHPLGIHVGLLTGSVKQSAKKQLYEAIKKGKIDLVVGTHALIQEKVEFHRLGFVVIDEQHRFGVAQRQKLLKKSAHMPHLLAMTATPIPRTLALTVYGELEISILNELPKGRQAIETTIVSPNSRESMYQKAEAEIKNGRQIYVVCPLIDNNPLSEKRSVEEEYEKLKKTSFAHRRIGLLHGQLSGEDKQKIMQEFSQGNIDILVSTTVIEVGVDVPNASIMIIENADQFGLAQAHQLRGRVGRGAHKSYCFLVSSTSFKPSRRLQELARSQDGFYLAEVDLKLRGPGEIYGRAQHGELNLQFATLGDSKLVAKTRAIARAFMDNPRDLLNYKELSSKVHMYQRLTTLN